MTDFKVMRDRARVSFSTFAFVVSFFAPRAAAQEHRAQQYKTLEEMPAVQRALLQRVIPNLDAKRWSVVYVDNAHMTSLDRETVKKTSEDQFDLWVRRDYVEPMKLSKGTADHALTREAVDCSGAHFRVLKSVAYSVSGSPVLVIETPFERQDIVPASVGETEYGEICHDAREIGKPSK